MNQNLIFYPCLALVLWTCLILFRISYLRLSLIKQKKVDYRYFKTYSSTFEVPHKLAAIERNYANLLETPPLFYALCLFLLFSQNVDSLFLICAWVYFILRVIHTVIHTGSNKLTLRRNIFGLGFILLISMWIRLGLLL